VAGKTNGKWTVHLTDRALRDIAGIESHSIERFGKRVAAQYLGKLEGESVASQKSLIFCETKLPFTSRSNFIVSSGIYLFAKPESKARSSS